jgi:metallo-beta-lactamase family protein
MQISFHGAVETVTGSQHLITADGKRLLLDCGLYQGKREEARRRNQNFLYDAAGVEAMVLSHAHIDHSGNIPNLVKQGFRGKIICTKATADLCGAMLPDSGHIQEEDVAYVNRQREKHGEAPVEPIYTREDALESLQYFEGVEYEQPYPLWPGVTCTLHDAGHVLGSAIVELNFQGVSGEPARRLVFTGDLGRAHVPLLCDPTLLTAADILLIESTYGTRTHPPIEESAGALKETIRRTSKRGGKVIIPCFAVERTQLLVYLLNTLYNQGELPEIPIYVDSPLAVNVTDIFRRHTDYFDAETQAYLRRDPGHDIFGFKQLRYIRDVEQSKRLNSLTGPGVIISASGMAEAGRIQHHLKNNIADSRNTILIVGWQAPNTLGRRIVEKTPMVRIYGKEYPLRAEVVTLNGFSNHADQPGLLSWAQGFKPPPKRTFVVHGDPDAATELAARLRQDLGFPEVMIPALHQTVEI